MNANIVQNIKTCLNMMIYSTRWGTPSRGLSARDTSAVEGHSDPLNSHGHKKRYLVLANACGHPRLYKRCKQYKGDNESQIT